MKFKILLLISPLLTLSISLFANPLADSVGVENLNGKKVVLHKLDPKDNYYSVGRRYNVSPKAIMQFNNNAPLKIGAVIKVPTELSFTAATQPPVQQSKPQVQPPVAQPKQQAQQPVAQQPKPQTTQPAVQQQTQAPVQQAAANTNTQAADTTPEKPVNQDNIQQYKVSAGETLYSIAKRFGTSVEDITKLNNLTSSTLTPGQVIKVRSGMPPEERPVVKQDATVVTTTQDSTTVDSAGNKLKANRFGLYEKNETGVATWIDDTSLDPKKELVLHRSAPIGTVIKITNPMNNHTTYAKVVGRFTDSEATKDVLIVMTKNTADALGALDKRVRVNISYGSPNPNE
ncbi:DPBB and LysM peptidoglycan-binding domain-containing protein [Mucilaginibacter aquaedulcis]|uniref:DPBB and LysM peptidoglycan-binding domain-containing protein n=1 Tax=Mucilaginibacter aquaedulcis TaxID=1187081 RepID=UPI0025B3EDC3|nr:LysM peptidoglycan-binding domain-containing protein [Mucilaginibacter aquaedulcis]MDN3547319.1 LysM peptidoglycan-binding domain-containing protein [Mucilaginibacter aquaedulcis]